MDYYYYYYILAASQENVPGDDESSLFHRFACLLNAPRSISVEQLEPSKRMGSAIIHKKNNYPKFALTLSPRDKASLVCGANACPNSSEVGVCLARGSAGSSGQPFS